jgi:colanic acid biosynthesis protein WcaH
MIPDSAYSQIVHTMPIPCVDMVVVDDEGNVLLMKRTNEPAKGQWWFPGGRIHFLETRFQAAVRKLKAECNLVADQMIELGTYDVFVDSASEKDKMHGVTTLFCARVASHDDLNLDSQSSEFDWRTPEVWQKLPLHPFIHTSLTTFKKYKRQGDRV